MKTCTMCKKEKSLADFSPKRDASDGKKSACKPCRRTVYKRYYENNKEGIKAKHLVYKLKRYKEDALHCTEQRLRSRLRAVTRRLNGVKTSRFTDILGCSIEKLKIHLEDQFLPGMTWGNRDKWHIDHITPLSSGKTQEDLQRLCHYTNLQPLWATDNLKKSDKLNYVVDYTNVEGRKALHRRERGIV
jgi:hypothetical protein